MRTALYRHFDRHGGLLYVGISNSHLRRLAQHQDSARWAEHITRVEIEYFDTREQALKAERAAIGAERPTFNTQGRDYKIGPWAILDAANRKADGWYIHYPDVVEMLDFYTGEYPGVEFTIVPRGSALEEACRELILGGRRILEPLTEAQLAEFDAQFFAS